MAVLDSFFIMFRVSCVSVLWRWQSFVNVVFLYGSQFSFILNLQCALALDIGSLVITLEPRYIAVFGSHGLKPRVIRDARYIAVRSAIIGNPRKLPNILASDTPPAGN